MTSKSGGNERMKRKKVDFNKEY